MTTVYRLRQGTRSLTARARPVDDALAEAELTPALYALFRQMRREERQHSLRVLRALQAEGDTPPELAIAALLHDCGKTRYPLRTWQRTLPVLTRTVAPGQAEKLTRRRPEPAWSRGFVVGAHHPAWSAELMGEAGAPDDAVWLAAHHADHADAWRSNPLYPLLIRLKCADDAN